ncbi:peptidoglycan D,D-transpeptidase FtsI family protein [Helicobacter cholecystus]|uniref:peptidoglycan D,D-transpeptidase FtsI family protein n=1 Tax=Helicobacter cholecystus TaxID=45498 RepID=UPI0027395E8D|nr:penicillin-binding protein 2 [Helicobacter cholecystus]
MSSSRPPLSDIQKGTSFFLLVLFIFILALSFLIALYFTISEKKRSLNPQSSKKDFSVRGTIYSSDGFSMASSEKLYKVSIIPQNIAPEKKELFVNLFSIYSNIPKEAIEEKLKNKGYTTLSYHITPIQASSLRVLNSKLNAYQVFQEFEENAKVYQKMGISIEVSGYSRQYPYGTIMEPLIGYTRKIHQEKITRVEGIKGSENFAQNYLNGKRDGEIEGNRDIGFNIIRNKDSKEIQKQDGLDVVLTLPLKLQKKMEAILDAHKQRLQAKEIIAGVMESSTGKILSLATSNRFDPKNIKKEDYPSLNITAIETSFEPGSIIKPIIYAILMQKKMIDPQKNIDLNNGVYKIGRHTIRDDHPLKNATPPQILIKSSNIGMIKLTQDLNSQEFLDALKEYGFGTQTQIDLPYEAQGVLPDITKLRGSYKASVSYGYGFRATFIQLLRAYATFNNGGKLITPRTIDYLKNNQDEHFKPKTPPPYPIISEQTSHEMKILLEEIVKKGTGKKANVEGVVMGGKTGTARIFINGKYTKRYNSSFFGFADDEKKAYTIGIVVLDPNVQEGYYGSQTAAPIFKEIIELLLKEKYLSKENINPLDKGIVN